MYNPPDVFATVVRNLLQMKMYYSLILSVKYLDEYVHTGIGGAGSTTIASEYFQWKICIVGSERRSPSLKSFQLASLKSPMTRGLAVKN